MAFEFHTQKTQYFSYQRQNALDYVIPFIEGGMSLVAGSRVLEVGCGEGGVLLAFVERGCVGTGVELVESRYRQAGEFLEEEVAAGKIVLYCRNIYDADFQAQFAGFFDLIVLKDVIEHIPDQLRLLGVLKQLLKPSGGYIYFGFPPWYMPFGGHQQICVNKRLSKLPYIHLLPASLYKALLEWGGEKPHTVQELLELQETGISIERFERIAAQSGFDVVRRNLYLINPIYKYKFGLTARLQYPVLRSIPFFRNFITTCAYYLVKSR
jgi:SAM-dependent methyltransferase